MAYVLIPHLDPGHRSIMSEILSRTSPVPVKEAQEGLQVEPNHAYVISPNTVMTIEEERLKLAPRELAHGGKHECIDHFMVSLAKQYREQAIGIVLSGTASDGSIGVETIKSEGGITFAQDESAEFSDMPRNAIATGCVDFVLPPESIALELSKISRHPYLLHPPPSVAPEAKHAPPDPNRERVFGLLRAVTGVDFAQYKQTTIERRIARRMAIRKIDTLPGYVHYLEDHPPEVRALHDELLINVTSFFRDPEAFEILKHSVFPALLKDRSAHDPVRIWIPGCSTGEEAYSILISLVEFQAERGIHVDCQLFGTDISERAVEKARSGIYDNGIRSEVSEDRLRRFFTPAGGGAYRISKPIRDLCVFAKQDLTRDPPFSRLDLLSCRNMLIYLGGALQKRVIPLFHYALKPGGFLFLGSSESVDRYSSLFSLLDKTHKVYRRLPGPSPEPPAFAPERFPKVEPPLRAEPEAALPVVVDVAKVMDRFLLAHCVPGVILLNSQDQVVEVRGDTAPFLRIAPGKLSASVLRLVREELVVDLDRAVRQAKETGLAARRAGIRFGPPDQLREIAIEVTPLQGTSGTEQHFVVLFRDVNFPPPPSAPLAPPGSPPPAKETENSLVQEIAKLTAELGGQRDYHQSIVEKLEAANEELRSAGEETLSANEELQSTNEELETSKEEIQSANEELATLNDELQHKNQEMAELNSDLANVILGSNVALAIVDTALMLRRFTPQAEKLLHLVASDVGRRITDFKASVLIPDLERTVLGVIDSLSPVEQEIQDGLGRWYSLRVRPYRDIENRIQGAVLIFNDINEIRKALLSLEEAHALTEGIVETVRMPLLILERDLRVRSANRSFYETFQVSKEETEGSAIYDLGNGQWAIPKLRTLLEDVLPKNSSFESMEVEHDFERIGRRTMLLYARQIRLDDVSAGKILLAIEDVTSRKQVQAEIEQLNAGLERRVHERTSMLEGARGEMEAFTYSVAHDLRAPLRAMGGFAEVLLDDYVDRPLDAQGKDFARRIIDSSQRMDTLIQDLLSYSQLSRDQDTAVAVDGIDLNEVLDGILVGMASELSARKAEITVEKPLPTVRAHRGSLQQVLTNLASNAVKFVAPDVRPRVRIWAEPRGEWVRLWIEDNGIGIEPQYQEKIFRVFERLNRSEAYPGTGIGLAIVRRAVGKMGGRVGVESAPGKGSRFWIELKK